MKKLISRQFFEDTTGEVTSQYTKYFGDMDRAEKIEILEQIRNRFVAEVEGLNLIIDREKKGIS